MGNCVGSKGIKKDPKILTEEEIKLLLDNTRLTRPQIIALHRNFLKECPTGKLTKKDFVKLFKEVHPSENKKEKADKFCEYVFKVIDHNNLGYISFQDFVLCFSLTSDGDFRQKCEFAFKLYDLDKDGKISKKEMTQVLTALYDLSGITDRKKNNAPAKKVEEIIKKINHTYQQQQAAAAAAAGGSAPAPAAPAAAPVDKKAQKKAEKEQKDREAKEKKEREKEKKEREAREKKEAKAAKSAKPGKDAAPAAPAKEEKKPKEPKKEKAPKEPKPAKAPKPAKQPKEPEFITKDQFIDACTQDETLKKLFVDSIFCNQGDCSDATNNALNNLNVDNKISVEVNPGALASPSLSAKLSPLSVNVNGPVLDVSSSSPVAESKTVSVELTQPEITLPSASLSVESNNNNNSNSNNDEHQNPSDVNGVYNIREETNYVTSYQVSSQPLNVELTAPSLSVETSNNNENNSEEKRAAESQ